MTEKFKIVAAPPFLLFSPCQVKNATLGSDVEDTVLTLKLNQGPNLEHF